MFPNFFSAQTRNAVALELDIFEPKPVGKLLVGNRHSVSRESLFACDVGAVVCCSEELFSLCKTLPVQYNTKITLLDPTFIAQLESPQLQEVILFIANGLRQHKSVLIFCETGLAKSAILTSFFLMKTYHISLSQATNLIERAQGQRLKLNHSLAQLAVDFEMHLFNRNSMMVDQGSLLVLPEYVEGTTVEMPRRRPRASSPFSLLGTIMILFAVIIALIAQIPTSHREKVLEDIQNLVEESTNPSSITETSTGEDSSLVSRMSSLFKVDERQEMFDKCKLSSASASEFLQARDALRQVVLSFSDVYQKSYSDYFAGVVHYEKSSNLTSILQQQLLILNLQEQQFAQQDQLVAAAETVQKINQVEKQLDKLARERKSLVKDRLTPLRDDYYRRVKAIVETFPSRNESLQAWISGSSASLQDTQSTLTTFVTQERAKMNERELQYREQVRISQLELEEAREQLQTLIAQSNQAMESLQFRLQEVQTDLLAMDKSLSEWTKIIDDAIAVASEGSEAPKNLPQHHHRDHPHLIKALKDEIEAIRRTSQLGQQVFEREIDLHIAKYEQALEQLQKLEQEKRLFEEKVAQAMQQLSRWQALIVYAKEEQHGFAIPYVDLVIVGQHQPASSTSLVSKKATFLSSLKPGKSAKDNDDDATGTNCLNVMSLEVTATIATNALSTGALVTECTSRAIRDLQAHVLQVQSDVEPKHQQYIAAKNEHLKIVEKKRRFNDTLEAMEFQKESLVLQRKYQEAQRILQDIAEEKRSFQTIDQDIARKEQLANAADVVWHTAERELQRWISELRVQVAQEQRTRYPLDILFPRVEDIDVRLQAVREAQAALDVAYQAMVGSVLSAAVSDGDAKDSSNSKKKKETAKDNDDDDDVVVSTLATVATNSIFEPMRLMYEAEKQHVVHLIDQLAAMTAVSSPSEEEKEDI